VKTDARYNRLEDAPEGVTLEDVLFDSPDGGLDGSEHSAGRAGGL